MIRASITDREVVARLKDEAARRGFRKASKVVSTLAIERLNQLLGERAAADRQASPPNTPAAA